MIMSGQVELLNHPRLAKQLASLERRKGRQGKDSVDAPPRQHEDVANAACGALALVGLTRPQFIQNARFQGYAPPTQNPPGSISVRTDGGNQPASVTLEEWQAREARLKPRTTGESHMNSNRPTQTSSTCTHPRSPSAIATVTPRTASNSRRRCERCAQRSNA